MRVLLDEQLDRRLKQLFDAEIDAITVADAGWKGMKNGQLLRTAQTEFDAVITMDKGIEHQQNLSNLEMGIIILSAKSTRYVDVAPLITEVNQILESLTPGQVIHIPRSPTAK